MAARALATVVLSVLAVPAFGAIAPKAGRASSEKTTVERARAAMTSSNGSLSKQTRDAAPRS